MSYYWFKTKSYYTRSHKMFRFYSQQLSNPVFYPQNYSLIVNCLNYLFCSFCSKVFKLEVEVLNSSIMDVCKALVSLHSSICASFSWVTWINVFTAVCSSVSKLFWVAYKTIVVSKHVVTNSYNCSISKKYRQLFMQLLIYLYQKTINKLYLIFLQWNFGFFQFCPQILLIKLGFF